MYKRQSYAYVGGIAGSNVGTISDCYNTGSVSAAATASYADASAGGITGNNDAEDTISNCYYLDTAVKGVGSLSDTSTDTSIRCTVEQMKQKETFVGFDFETIWEIQTGEAYPCLLYTSNIDRLFGLTDEQKNKGMEQQRHDRDKADRPR